MKRDGGKVLLLSSHGPDLAEEDIIRIYGETLVTINSSFGDSGSKSRCCRMEKQSLVVGHDGGRLSNAFGCWANWEVPDS